MHELTYIGARMEPSAILAAPNVMVLQSFVNAVAVNNFPVLDSDNFLDAIRSTVKEHWGERWQVDYWDPMMGEPIENVCSGMHFLLRVSYDMPPSYSTAFN